MHASSEKFKGKHPHDAHVFCRAVFVLAISIASSVLSLVEVVSGEHLTRFLAAV